MWIDLFLLPLITDKNDYLVFQLKAIITNVHRIRKF